MAAESEQPKVKKHRKARTRQIFSQAPGLEASSEGEQRVETEASSPDAGPFHSFQLLLAVHPTCSKKATWGGPRLASP